ncbi:MAG: HAMP domain-containing histidine kinase [Marinilabiliaceae bacterium]|nr:HAMP domain-containing histidine kinase [Marinilabiliaceae bacterium]
MNCKKTFKYLIIAIVCNLFFVQTLPSQTPEIDSLEQVLVSKKLTDYEKTELLATLATEYRFVDTTNCRMYAREAIQLAQKIGFKKAAAAATITLAQSYFISDFDTVNYKKYTIQAIQIAQNVKGLEIQEGTAYMDLGNYYLYSNQFYLAHNNYKKAEKIFLKINYLESLYLLYRNLYILFAYINDDANSLYYSKKKLEIAIEQGDSLLILEANYLIGLLRFKYDNNKEEGLTYFQELHKKIKFYSSSYTDFIAGTIGDYLLELNRPKDALDYLFDILESKNIEFDYITLPDIYLIIAEAYIMLEKADSADYFLAKCMEHPVVVDTRWIGIYRVRSQIDYVKGNFKSSLENYHRFHYFSDSLNEQEKTLEISQLKNWLELEQKDNENDILFHQMQKQQKLLILLSIGSLLILILLAIALLLYRKSSEKNSELKKTHSFKNKLFSIVSHNLRSPISYISEILLMANKVTTDTENRAKILKNVSTRLENAHGLIENLIIWAKTQMKDIKPINEKLNIDKQIDFIVNDLRQYADEKNIELENNTQNHFVFADIEMFIIILRNIINNAIKYSYPNSKVTIRSEQSDNEIIILVKDQGIGIPEKMMENLFQLSETKSTLGTEKETGTGLGLVLCDYFVKKMGGKIWVESEVGKGSIFNISLRRK